MVAAEILAADLIASVLAGTVFIKSQLGGPTDAEKKASGTAELSAVTLGEV